MWFYQEKMKMKMVPVDHDTGMLTSFIRRPHCKVNIPPLRTVFSINRQIVHCPVFCVLRSI